MVAGERNLDVVADNIDSGSKQMLSDILDLLKSDMDVPFASLFSIGICTAVNKKDLQKTKYLLDMGYPVNQVCPNLSGSQGTISAITLLHYAVQIGDMDCIDVILQYGGDPTIVDQDDDSPMLMAIDRKNMDVVSRFLSTEFDFSTCLNHIKRDGRHPLVSFFKKDPSDDLVQRLCDKGIQFDNPPHDWGGVMREVVECIDKADIAGPSSWETRLMNILTMGFPVNLPLTIFTSPITTLFYACAKSKHRIIRLLCTFGADVNQEGSGDGYVPIEAALHFSGATEECAIALIEAGVSPDYLVSVQGRTVTHMAANPKNWVRLFEVCLKHGGNLLIPCDDDTLPMPFIAQRNYLHFLPPFLEHVPNKVDVLNALQPNSGKNALGYAIGLSDPEAMVTALLEAGASPLIRLPDADRTLLHYVILDGNINLCDLLLRYGADANAPANESLPRPLDFAINRKFDDIAVLLVSRGRADPFITTGTAPGSPMSIMLATESLQIRLRDAWVALGEEVPESYLTPLRPVAPPERRARVARERAPVAVPVVPPPATTRQKQNPSSMTASAVSPLVTPPPPPSAKIFEGVPTPPAPPMSTASAKPAPDQVSSGQECKICMEQPANASFVHGSSSHITCCYACAMKVYNGTNPVCPICRVRIERVTQNFI